jgi:hypothetical protein
MLAEPRKDTSGTAQREGTLLLITPRVIGKVASPQDGISGREPSG